jgi:hypothetical protein
MGYFGEKIGMYFCFLGHFTTFMIPIAAIGLVAFLIIIAQSSGTNNMSAALSTSIATPIFCILLAVWSQVDINHIYIYT